jgi:hypothetical protein
MHWTQTPAGRKKMSERLKAFHKTPEGKRLATKRGLAIKLSHARRRNGEKPAASPKLLAPSGRAMLVELARPEAERKILRLQREIETLRLFLDRTKP